MRTSSALIRVKCSPSPRWETESRRCGRYPQPRTTSTRPLRKFRCFSADDRRACDRRQSSGASGGVLDHDPPGVARPPDSIFTPDEQLYFRCVLESVETIGAADGSQQRRLRPAYIHFPDQSALGSRTSTKPAKPPRGAIPPRPRAASRRAPHAMPCLRLARRPRRSGRCKGTVVSAWRLRGALLCLTWEVPRDADRIHSLFDA